MACAEQRGPAGRSIVEYEQTWEALLRASLANKSSGERKSMHSDLRWFYPARDFRKVTKL